MVSPVRRRSFAHRLVRSLAMMTIPLLVVAALQLVVGRHTAERSTATAHELAAESSRLSGARDALDGLEAQTVALYLGQPGARARLVAQRGRTVRALREAHALDDPQQRRLVEDAERQLWAAFEELRAVNGLRSAGVAVLGRFHALVFAAETSLAQAEALSVVEVEREANATARDHDRWSVAVLALLVLSALTAAVLARRLRRDLRAGLAPLSDAARRFGEGDLAHRVDSSREDELGQLADAYDAMAERMFAMRARLLHQARHDALTGLPNRTVLDDRVAHAAARAPRTAGMPHVGVVLLDLDGFKTVNDTQGHRAGDALLVAVAERLSGVVRPADTVVRLGGDEFAVLLEDLADPAEAGVAAERLVRALEAPVELDGRAVRITASAGVRACPAARADAEELLRDADVAMYRAKGAGRGRHQVFEIWMQTDVAERVVAIEELRTGIEDGQLELHHQPIVDLDGEAVVGVEALVRWRHPERGLVPPNDFIPLAEDTGLVVPLGAWVLTQAVEQLRELNAARLDARPLSVSVNVSSLQLQDPHFVALVTAAIARLDGRGHLLTLEVTEHAFVREADEARTVLERLRTLGVQVAIDDFGTGWSSLAYLRRLPVDVLKIDRSFLMDDEPALVEAIVGLAHTLGLRTVAEGVERSDQLEHLRAIGCDAGQGYLFSRPMPLAELLPVAARA